MDGLQAFPEKAECGLEQLRESRGSYPFAGCDLADWVALLEGKDACFAPVLRLSEVAEHPHMSARSSYVLKNGRVQCAPAPRFSRTPGEIQDAKVADELLNRWRTS